VRNLYLFWIVKQLETPIFAEGNLTFGAPKSSSAFFALLALELALCTSGSFKGRDFLSMTQMFIFISESWSVFDFANRWALTWLVLLNLCDGDSAGLKFLQPIFSH
jgi:hypothetical protein